MRRLMKRIAHLVALLGLIGLPLSLTANTTTTHHTTRRSRAHVQESTSATQHITHLQHSRRSAHLVTASLTTTHGRTRRASLNVHHRYYERFTGNSFADAD